MQRLALLFILVLACLAASAHESMSLRELMLSFGTDLDKAKVRRETLAPGLYILFGAGGNVVVSIGDQGVLMVDSQFPEMLPMLKGAIREVGGGEIDFTINTHWHFDHADSNPMLGREGSWMISQINSRRMMLNESTIDYGDRFYKQPPYPAEGLPVLTFDDTMQMFFNGQRIDILHFDSAHTTGDAVVWFRHDNVIHMGDVFVTRFPFIDTGNGGNLDGVIAFSMAVLEIIDEDTAIVCGHGPVATYGDRVDYVAMLDAVRDRMMSLIDRGYSLQAVMEARPTDDFDGKYGNAAGFIARAYDDLTRQVPARR